MYRYIDDAERILLVYKINNTSDAYDTYSRIWGHTRRTDVCKSEKSILTSWIQLSLFHGTYGISYPPKNVRSRINPSIDDLRRHLPLSEDLVSFERTSGNSGSRDLLVDSWLGYVNSRRRARHTGNRRERNDKVKKNGNGRLRDN